MLLLFDIDMTLISTDGSGMKAMRDAGAELFGGAFSAEGVAFAGRLDPLIMGDMLVRNGRAATAENLAALTSAYLHHLERRLTVGVARALPGVMPLLNELESREAVTLGLLTGNFERAGWMKLRASGIDPSRFAVRVWGDESPVTPPRREHLVEVGMERFRRLRGRDSRRVTVIGDTPDDVACAKAHGCRSLAVATGQYNGEALKIAGADRVVRDLSETPDIVRWLTTP